MTRYSVLIADDEIPYDDDDERNRQTKEVLLKNISGATEVDYVKGRDGMKRACDVLREAAMDLTIARTVKEAKKAIARKGFDVAIIDLGWMGDQAAEKRETAGWEILHELRESDHGQATPVIMYSNRFEANVTLAQTAAERSTLPLPKTYTAASHQTLVAAVRFLAMSKVSPAEQFFSRALATWEQRESALRRAFWLCLALSVLVTLLGIVGAAMLLAGKTNAAAFQLVVSVLTGGVLAFVSTQVRSAARDSQKAMQEVRDHVKRSQSQEPPAA